LVALAALGGAFCISLEVKGHYRLVGLSLVDAHLFLKSLDDQASEVFLAFDLSVCHVLFGLASGFAKVWFESALFHLLLHLPFFSSSDTIYAFLNPLLRYLIQVQEHVLVSTGCSLAVLCADVFVVVACATDVSFKGSGSFQGAFTSFSRKYPLVLIAIYFWTESALLQAVVDGEISLIQLSLLFVFLGLANNEIFIFDAYSGRHILSGTRSRQLRLR